MLHLIDICQQYIEKASKPFNLYFVMEIADQDLKGITIKSFEKWIPIVRDTIAGLQFMHLKKIVHRDIKPENIIKFNDNRYALVDYGEGLNLNYLE